MKHAARVALAAVALWASLSGAAFAAGTIQVGLAGITLPASNACVVTTRDSTVPQPVVACNEGEYFYLHFKNLPDGSRNYYAQVRWRTESTNTSTSVEWDVYCIAITDGATDVVSTYGSSWGAAGGVSAGQRLLNVDSSAGWPLYNQATGAQCAVGTACASAEVTCKVLANKGIAGAEVDYRGLVITTTD